MEVRRRRESFTVVQSFLVIDGEKFYAAEVQQVAEEFKFNHFSSSVPDALGVFLAKRGVLEDVTRESDQSDLGRVYRRGDNFAAFFKSLRDQLGEYWLINGWEGVEIVPMEGGDAS